MISTNPSMDSTSAATGHPPVLRRGSSVDDDVGCGLDLKSDGLLDGLRSQAILSLNPTTASSSISLERKAPWGAGNPMLTFRSASTEEMPRQAAPPNQLQRNSLQIFFIAAAVLAALCAPLAFRAIFYGIKAFLNIDSAHELTGEPKVSIILGNVVGLTVLVFPFVLFLTLAIVFARRRKRQTLSPAAIRAQQVLSSFGWGLSCVFTRDRCERALSLTAFALGLGALFNILGLASAFATQEEVVEDLALGFLIPIDPVILAWAIPGTILGHICRKKLFELDGLALAGKIISIICVVLSFTKVGAVLPLIVHSIVQALRLLDGG